MKIEIKRKEQFIPFDCILTFETKEQVISFLNELEKLVGAVEDSKLIYDLNDRLFTIYDSLRLEFIEQGNLYNYPSHTVNDQMSETESIPTKPNYFKMKRNNSNDEEME